MFADLGLDHAGYVVFGDAGAYRVHAGVEAQIGNHGGAAQSLDLGR